MRYFVMEPQGDKLLPLAPKGEDAEIVISSVLDRFYDIDYDMRSELISERLKLLLEMYMPRYNFRPVVYLDQPKEEQLIFWRFRPPTYTEDFQATYKGNGMLSHFVPPNNDVPIIFTARSPKRGVRSIVVRMAVAEGALRRGIFGVKFTQVTEE